MLYDCIKYLGNEIKCMYSIFGKRNKNMCVTKERYLVCHND